MNLFIHIHKRRKSDSDLNLFYFLGTKNATASSPCQRCTIVGMTCSEWNVFHNYGMMVADPKHDKAGGARYYADVRGRYSRREMDLYDSYESHVVHLSPCWHRMKVDLVSFPRETTNQP